MDVTKPLVIDGTLWPPNTVEPKDVLTKGRIFYYDSPMKGIVKLTVFKLTYNQCHTEGIDGTRFADDWNKLEMARITLI